MAITAAGVGSGLDIENIVSQLMSLERRPLEALERRESDYRAQLSGMGQLKSAVSSFQDAMKELGDTDKFRIYAPSVSDEEVLAVETDAKAAAGIYNVDVTRLAQNHKMGSDEHASDATFGGGGDSITLQVGDDSMVVDLSSAKTLGEIREAINDDPDNPGVTATILRTGDGNERLILTADESGYDARVQVSYTGSVGTALGLADNNRDSDGELLTDPAGLDAIFSIDGYELTSSTNKVSSALDGLTLELKQVGSSTLNVTRDTEAIQENVQAFVNAYNEVQSTIKSLGEGALAGESSLRSIQSRMRNVINTAPVGLSGSFGSLADVGIRTNAKTGQLDFNASTLTDALEGDFASVSNVFAHDDQGFAFRFEALADSLLDTDGLIDVRQDGINDRIRRLEDGQASIERRLELKEVAMRKQYAALDSLIGQLNITSQFLSQQL